MQCARYGNTSLLNGDASVNENIKSLELSDEAHNTLKLAAGSYGLSGRGYHKTIKLARTIADLERSASIEKGHILEALRYRKK
jgi:magnesium chelatase family protein